MSFQGGNFSSVLSEFDQRIAKIPSILQENGSFFVSSAQSTCPVITGTLREGNQFEATQNTLRCYNDVEYAGYVNFGTSRQSPQPFFDRAIEAVSQKLQEDLTQI